MAGTGGRGVGAGDPGVVKRTPPKEQDEKRGRGKRGQAWTKGGKGQVSHYFVMFLIKNRAQTGSGIDQEG